jgi:hypothetical protein
VGSPVIDLGLDREPPRVERPRSIQIRRHRAGIVAAVVAAALALTAGSAPAMPHLREVRIAAGPGDAVALSTDQLFVFPSDTTWSLGPRTISAYQLATGRLAWRERLPLEGRVRQVIPAPGALLIVVERDSKVDTVAIDATSGRVRWSMEYQPLGVTASGRLLLGVAAAWPDPRAQRVVAVELATGRPAWAYDVPPDAFHDMEWSAGRWAGGGQSAGTRSVIARPSGHVAVRDLETGQLMDEADLGGPQSGNRWFQLAGDLLLAGTLADGQDIVTAYGLPALDRRWTVTLSLEGGYVSADCGGALCFFSRATGLRVVDRTTGATRWTDPRWQTIETVGGRLLGYAWPSSGSHTTTAVLDPATGGELLDLGQWSILHPVWTGGQTPAVRLDPGSGRAWFAVVDADAAAVRVVASASGISGDCVAGERIVACRRVDGSIGVWRFP